MFKLMLLMWLEIDTFEQAGIVITTAWIECAHR